MWAKMADFTIYCFMVCLDIVGIYIKNRLFVFINIFLDNGF